MHARPQPVNSANWWWERSANSGNSNNFCNVTSGGNADWNNANNSNGVAPFGSTSMAERSSGSETTGGIQDNEMQGAATAGRPARNMSRHADGAGTRRLVKGGRIVRFDEVFTFGHLYEAGQACCNGVRWKASTQIFEARLPSWAAIAQDELEAGTWKSSGFNRFTVNERGKTRSIQAVHIAERMVQKCLVRNCLRPLIVPRLISDSHATIPGHGTERAIARLKEHLRWHYARHGTEGYAVTMDYHDYFGTIDHAKLIEMYSRLPMDDRLLALTAYLVNCFEGPRGLGLGSEISQISAVFYVSPVDHLAKDAMGVHCYGRYMDDSYAILPTRREAEELLDAVRLKSEELGLVLNDRMTSVRPLKRGFKYLKKKVGITESGKVLVRPLRESSVRERRRIKHNIEAVVAGEKTPEAERQSWESWKSHCLKLDAHRTVQEVGAYRLRLLEEAGLADGAATHRPS